MFTNWFRLALTERLGSFDLLMLALELGRLLDSQSTSLISLIAS
jgi:hypothetical protein